VVRKLYPIYTRAVEGSDRRIVNETDVEGDALPTLYDLDSSRPTDAYRRVWDSVARELRALGVPMEDYADV